MVEIENIPNGIIDELKLVYADIDYSNYNGILTEDIRARKLGYKEPINDEASMVYIFRGVITEDNILKLYAVLECGLVRNI